MDENTSPGKKSFKQLEQEGWHAKAHAYNDYIGAITSQAVEPMLNAVYTTQGEVDGGFDVRQQLAGQFDRAVTACERAELLENGERRDACQSWPLSTVHEDRVLAPGNGSSHGVAWRCRAARHRGQGTTDVEPLLLPPPSPIDSAACDRRGPPFPR